MGGRSSVPGTPDILQAPSVVSRHQHGSVARASACAPPEDPGFNSQSEACILVAGF